MADLVRARHAARRLLRSPHAHARIRAIDAAAARSTPGRRRVLTGPDLRAERAPDARRVADGAATRRRSMPALALDKVALRGRGRRGGRRGRVATRPRTRSTASPSTTSRSRPWSIRGAALSDCEPSRARQPARQRPPEPRIQSGRRRGAAFARRARLGRRSLRFRRHAGVAIENRACLAEWEPAEGALTLWTSTQVPGMVRDVLAELLDRYPPIASASSRQTSAAASARRASSIRKRWRSPRWRESSAAPSSGSATGAKTSSPAPRRGTRTSRRSWPWRPTAASPRCARRILADVGAYSDVSMDGEHRGDPGRELSARALSRAPLPRRGVGRRHQQGADGALSGRGPPGVDLRDGGTARPRGAPPRHGSQGHPPREPRASRRASVPLAVRPGVGFGPLRGGARAGVRRGGLRRGPLNGAAAARGAAAHGDRDRVLRGIDRRRLRYSRFAGRGHRHGNGGRHRSRGPGRDR